jgi:hypothetical protein
MYLEMFGKGQLLYYVLLAWAFQHQCRFKTVEFKETGTAEPWPMPLPPDSNDNLGFPFERVGTDGLIVMEKYLRHVGALSDGPAGMGVVIPVGFEVSQAARNNDLIRTRLHFVSPERWPVGLQTILHNKAMVDNLELKWFNRSTGMLGTLCEEAFFGANKLGFGHNIWAEHNGEYFYGLEVADGHHTGQTVTAKKTIFFPLQQKLHGSHVTRLAEQSFLARRSRRFPFGGLQNSASAFHLTLAQSL